jgi:hypothetical protein
MGLSAAHEERSSSTSINDGEGMTTSNCVMSDGLDSAGYIIIILGTQGTCI